MARPAPHAADLERERLERERLERVDRARAMLARWSRHTIPMPPEPSREVALPVTVYPKTAIDDKTRPLTAKEATAIMTATNATIPSRSEAKAENVTLAQAIRAANLARGDAATCTLQLGSETYTVTLARHHTVESALRERKQITGWLTLASSPYRNREPIADGSKPTYRALVEDPTPEGQKALLLRSNKKLAEERGARIRQIAREMGCSLDDAKHSADTRDWIPGVSEPIPDGWVAPKSRVAAPFKAQTGEQGTAAVTWAQAREGFVEGCKNNIRAGRITPQDATKMLKLWDTAHPQPAHTNAGS